MDLNKKIQRPLMKTNDGDNVFHYIPGNLLLGLQEKSREQGVTLFMTLMSIVKTLIHHYCEETDVVIGSPVAGRFRKDLEEQVGCYLNLLPLRDEVTADLTFDQLLASVKKTTLDAYKNQMYPILKLAEDLAVEVDFSRSLGYDVLFTFHNNDVVLDLDQHVIDKLGGLRVEAYPFPTAVNRYDLSFDMKLIAGAIEVAMEFNTDLLNKDQVQQVGKDMSSLARKIIKDSGRTIGDLLADIEML